MRDDYSLSPGLVVAHHIYIPNCLLYFSTLSSDIGPSRVFVAPNSVMYVKKDLRKGILPEMLEEILHARVMIKKSMKKLSADDGYRKSILFARQYALKMIANVTYGYAAAGWSGRMPCVDIADSVVQTARETLEKSIRFIKENINGAKVVYGDTGMLIDP